MTGGLTELPLVPETTTPHFSAELVRESAVGGVADFLTLFSSLSLFLFFFCLLDNPATDVLGDPGVEDSGVLEVRDSLPDTELLELLLDVDSS